MTIKELREIIADYPDDQFIHIRLWMDSKFIGNSKSVVNLDTVASKAQQSTSGALLLTGYVGPSQND